MSSKSFFFKCLNLGDFKRQNLNGESANRGGLEQGFVCVLQVDFVSRRTVDAKSKKKNKNKTKKNQKLSKGEMRTNYSPKWGRTKQKKNFFS